MLGETGDWDGALSRITTMINGGSDPVEGLAHGLCSGGLVEAYARQIEQDKGIELGMAMPVILAALSGATQGGFEAPMLQVKATAEVYDWTPLVVQFIGVAEAGQSKSTLLREIEGSLRFALDRKGMDHRRELVASARKKAENKHVGVTIDSAVFDKVYNQGGLCPSSLADQGTQEGIRKMMSINGSHRMILTAEPDVLAEISQYQSKGKSGSLGLMLRGWGQENLDADRVQDPQNLKEPSLPFVILTQPESFDEHTGGGQERDRFVDRGVFSRTLLCKAERTPLPEVADDDDEAWLAELNTVDTSLMATPLMKFRQDMHPVFDRLVQRTNAYRVSKGIEGAWKQVAAIYNELQRPEEIKRTKLSLYPAGDPAARTQALMTMRKLQRLRLRLIAAVRTANASNPGTGTLLEPLAIRYTDHVMRIAALMSLADDPNTTVVDAGYLEDVATRIMPWLWANWDKVIRDRMEASARSLAESGIMRNAKDLDLTGTDRILKALVYWEQREGLTGAFEGIVQSKIIDKATRKLPSGDATKAHFKKLLEQMVTDGLVEIVGKSESASKQAMSFRYKITQAGRAELDAAHAQ